MKSWPFQSVEGPLGEIVEEARTNGPQMLSRDGEPTAVVVSIDDWRRLNERSRPTAIDVLLAPYPKADLELPDRKQWRLREPPVFDD